MRKRTRRAMLAKSARAEAESMLDKAPDLPVTVDDSVVIEVHGEDVHVLKEEPEPAPALLPIVLPTTALDERTAGLCELDSGLGLPIEKRNLWISPGGKVRLAKLLLGMLTPVHSAYSEVFAGSAAVFFRKDKVGIETLNDRDPEIAQSYVAVQSLSDDDIVMLAKMPWVGDRHLFQELTKQDPKTLTKTERLHRYLYLSRFSYGKMVNRGFAPDTQGKPTKVHKRLPAARDRLQGVAVYCGEYDVALAKCDSAEALHYLDPPYPGYNANLGEAELDEAAFMEVLKGLKGKFLVTYGVRGKFPALVRDSGFSVKRIYPKRVFSVTGRMGTASRLGTLIVTNYDLMSKGLDLDDAPFEIGEWDALAEDTYAAIEEGALYKGISFVPTVDMAVLAREALSHGGIPFYVRVIAKKIARRVALTVDEVYRAANHLLVISKMADSSEAAVLRLAVGGDAGAIWLYKKIEAMVARETCLGRRYHAIGGLAMPGGPVVVQKDCVVMTDGGPVFRAPTDDVHVLLEKALPVPHGMARNVLVEGHHALDHAPMYDLVLVPSAGFGQEREVVKAVGDLDYNEGDTGMVSVQLWGDGVEANQLNLQPGAGEEVVVTKLFFHRCGLEPDGHWEGGTLLTPRVISATNELVKMAEEGAGTVPMVMEVKRAVGAEGWEDVVPRGDLRKMTAFDDPKTVAVQSGSLTGKQVSKSAWVAGVQEPGYREFFFDGDLLKGRYVLMQLPAEAELAKAVWSRAFINDLPDSSFLWIAPDGEKDESNRTTPRSLRKFPYKGPDGKIDLPHLRNAIARIPQAKHPKLTADKKWQLQERARRILADQDGVEKAWVFARFDELVDAEELKKYEEKATEPEYCILRKDEEKRIVLGPVLVPEVVDLQGDIISAEAIEKAAHEYLVQEAMKDGAKGVQHEAFEPKLHVVESYIAPVDFEIGGRFIVKGTWMLGFKILDDETWDQVKKGELRGFSIGGVAKDSEKI